MERSGTAGGEPRQAEPAEDGRAGGTPDSATGEDGERGIAQSVEFCGAILRELGDRAIFALGPDGRIASWCGGAEWLTGYTADDAVGRPWTDLLAEDEAEAPTLAEVVDSAERQVWWRVRGGTRRRVAQRVRRLERDGVPIGYAVVARDLTGERAAEAPAEARSFEEEALLRERELRSEVQAAERRAAFLAEASSILVATSLNFDSTIRGLARLAVSRLADWCIVYTLTDDGQVRRMQVAHRDPRCDEVLRGVAGTVLRSAPGHPVLEAIGHRHTVTFAAAPEVFWQALEETPGVDANLRAELRVGPGIVVPLIARGKALGAVALLSASRPNAFEPEDLELAEELGRRAALAIDNARLYRDAQDANRARADFLAIMSHELRTPLNAILGYADLMDAEVSGPITSRQRRQLGRVRSSARHLLQLIEEILSFARMEAGGEELRLERITVRDLVAEVLSVIEPLAAAKGLPLHVLPGADRTVLETDPGKARQILVNILSNAVKFTDRGEITLEFRQQGDDGIFLIRDTGIGIGADDLERIFDPFWQGERPLTRRVGGTGLGLSVSRRFARLLKGEIAVESEPNVGTTFLVRLPLRAGIALGRTVSTGLKGEPAVS